MNDYVKKDFGLIAIGKTESQAVNGGYCDPGVPRINGPVAADGLIRPRLPSAEAIADMLRRITTIIYY